MRLGSRFFLALSILLNLALLGWVAYLMAYDPVVATVTTQTGAVRTVLAGVVNSELIERHGEEVQGDLVGRALIDLAAEESQIELDQAELEARWKDWLNEPGTRARIETGETTEAELRERLVTLVLLDQLTWNDFSLKEQEELLQEYFENHQRQLEQLRLRHILVESQKDAHDIAQRLAAGVDFAELARRFSLDPLTREQGGDLGWKGRADLAPDLTSFLFLLPTGTASNPVSSPNGWHLFLVEERRDTFEDCRDLVRRELMRQRRPDTMDELRRRFKVERVSSQELLKKLRRPGFFPGRQTRAYQVPADSDLTAPAATAPPTSPASP